MKPIVKMKFVQQRINRSRYAKSFQRKLKKPNETNENETQKREK